MMEQRILIKLCTQEEPLQPPDGITTVEDLCIFAAKHCGITPVARHLFALYNPEQKVWLSPCKRLDTSGNKRWILCFLLRFKTPSIKRLKELADSKTFNYYFHQMRIDFVTGKIPEAHQCREKALGLAAADVIRKLIEEKQSLEDVTKNGYHDFLPPELATKGIYKYILRDPLQKAILKGLANSKHDVDYVKEEYMQQLTELVPSYGYETFAAQVDEDGKVWQVIMQVNPHHPEQPGIRMKLHGCKSGWTCICSVEDLCYVSMRNDGTVEISRRNGVPQYLKFEGVDQMQSFISLLDGYYRLMEKWTFNVCKDLPTPSLQQLRVLKCHGPVGRHFAHQKLKEKCHNEPGSFLLRESTSLYNEYRLEVCGPSMTNGFGGQPQTFCIRQLENNEYHVSGAKETFPSIPKLIAYYSTGSEDLLLKRCVPPSEYDRTHLLLCRPENQDYEILKTRGECSCSAQCIPHDALVFSNREENIYQGSLTVVEHARLRRGDGELRDVAVKRLCNEAQIIHMQEFLAQCDRTLFFQCDAIVSTMGVILSNPLALVMEFLPLGRLDMYLQAHSSQLQQVDLVEATNYLARAMWYLEEQKCFHGKIRCHNILVSAHTDSTFKVKLADPGIQTYSEADIHWIPPECYSNYSLASKSTAADVWAFGTTLWQIFSYGKMPLEDRNIKEAKEWYQKGNHLPSPSDCHNDIGKLMQECWVYDPDGRKRPQTIMRDVNQILYEVYNSRRSHSYATVYPSQCSSQKPSPIKPPNPPTVPPPTDSQNYKTNFFKKALRLVSTNNNGNFSYENLSSKSMCSENSVATDITDANGDVLTVHVESLVSVGESDDPLPDNNTSLLDAGEQSYWAIDVNQLTFGETLGQGFYGEVQKATRTLCGGLVEEVVAVKRIKKMALSEAGFKDLLGEIEIMKKLHHKNIVEIKALVEEPETMLVMEYVKWGSLLAYLQMHKNLGCSKLLKFACDIAEGMEHLENKHIVHRDLAARNILVAAEDHVKISDFGLARFTEDDYYKMRTERNLPIRWYAPESIMCGKFSHKSDVWSYGVTLWEMFSFGEDPVIPGVKDTNLAEALQKGQRLRCPGHCPLDVYRLMGSCWEFCSRKRPSFSQIRKEVGEFGEASWT